MPRPKHQSTLSGLVDSDTDDALTTMPTPDSAAENNMATKKVRTRATKVRPTKVTKTKAPAHRASRRVTAKTQTQGGIEAPVRKGRRALADKTNRQYPSDTEEVDDFETADDEDATMEEAPLAEKMAPKQTKPKKKAAVGRGRAKVTKEAMKLKSDIEAATPDMPVVEARTTKRKGPAKKEVISEPFHEEVIAETQLSEAEVDDTLNEEVEETVFKSARNATRQRPQPLIQHRRAGSASDTERSDPALRRRLGDMTKKYENLHLKYQDMREIGLKEAERNFERLKKQSEEKTKGLLRNRGFADTLLTFYSKQRVDCLSERRIGYAGCIGKRVKELKEESRFTNHRNYGPDRSDHSTHHITVRISSGE